MDVLKVVSKAFRGGGEGEGGDKYWISERTVEKGCKLR